MVRSGVPSFGPLSILLLSITVGCEPKPPDTTGESGGKAAVAKDGDAKVSGAKVEDTKTEDTKTEDTKTGAASDPSAGSSSSDGGASPAPGSPTPSPSSDPATPSAKEIRISTARDADVGVDEPCVLELPAATGLPAVRGDGQRLAFLSVEGPANADSFALDHDLVIIDAAGEVEQTLSLWKGDSAGAVASAAACTTMNAKVRRRAREAQARLATGGWRPMTVLPLHFDMVRDLEVDETKCASWTAAPAPRTATGDPPPWLSCANRPRTLEVAVVAGPTLVVRVPGVKVWHREAAEGLRIPIEDSWEPGLCSSAPVMDGAWRDAKTGLVLLRLTGRDYIMDACDYRRVHRVLAVPPAGLPPLVWTRAPSAADIAIEGEEVERP